MRILLVRHGQTKHIASHPPGVERPIEDPLTKIGKQQINDLGEFLSTLDLAPELIVSSPYFRAKQTALILSKKLNIKIEYSDNLKEYNSGDWGGIRYREAANKFLKLDASVRYTFIPPDGESWLSEAKRITELINELQTRNIKDAILVSHYDPIKAAISYLTKVPVERWSDNKLYEPGSATLIEGQDDLWKLGFSNVK